MTFLRAAGGLLFLLLTAFLLSSEKKNISWRLVITGISLQILIGYLVLKVDFFASAFSVLSHGFVKILGFSAEGSRFLFGELAGNSMGFIFAFQVLPVIIFFSALTSALYHLNILQKVVFGMAWVMSKTMKLSGPESLSAAGNVFLGQTEAPLLVRPFIPFMNHSEIMCLMTGGMATIAGSVLAGYVLFLGGDDPVEQGKFAVYLLSASVMNAPAAIVVAKILIPDTSGKVNTSLKISNDDFGVNLIDALARGAADGLKLALNVGAMLLAFVAVIAAINFLLGDLLGDWLNLNEWVTQSTGGIYNKFSLEYLLGQMFRVFAFTIGIDWNETLPVGSLIGQKTVINEFVAYLSLSELKAAGSLSNRAIIISTYALCGFSNFSSIAILIGGIGGMAPNQQKVISSLGLKALAGATIACLMTATLAGAFLT
jgi:CNT family concentrative nucleoside transporter